ncbi:girdin-like [Trichogramma pretiosum]|uniref:girdin-like n=1 Tax=Trichogramma pretiosum TaxID=7493 RepID=UPI000C719394|nr:girdin-like [Trichogramma pretiosum]
MMKSNATEQKLPIATSRTTSNIIQKYRQTAQEKSRRLGDAQQSRYEDPKCLYAASPKLKCLCGETSKSRLSGFFANLAAKIRGSRTNESTTQNKISGQKVPNSKKLINNENGKNGITASNKRKKIEATENTNLLHQKAKKETRALNESNSKSKRHQNQMSTIFENKTSHTLASTSCTFENVCKAKPSKLRHREFSCVNIDNDGYVEKLIKKKKEEEVEKTIGMYRTIVDNVCEKMQKAEESKTSMKLSGETEMLTAPEIARAIQDLVNENHKAEKEEEVVEEPAIVEEPFPVAKQSSFRWRRLAKSPKRDEADRLRKTIHWLEEGARQLREDLAKARSELHEERKAAKIAKRNFEAKLKEATTAEAIKYKKIIADLKFRLSQTSSRSVAHAYHRALSVDILKVENYKDEIAELKKRLVEAERTIQEMRSSETSKEKIEKENDLEE